MDEAAEVFGRLCWKVQNHWRPFSPTISILRLLIMTTKAN